MHHHVMIAIRTIYNVCSTHCVYHWTSTIVIALLSLWCDQGSVMDGQKSSASFIYIKDLCDKKNHLPAYYLI